MVPGDRAIRDTRTTESRLRDSRTESGREWPRNRLCEVRRKCIRHKPRERGEKSTLWRSSAYVISKHLIRGGERWIRTRDTVFRTAYHVVRDPRSSDRSKEGSNPATADPSHRLRGRPSRRPHAMAPPLHSVSPTVMAIRALPKLYGVRAYAPARAPQRGAEGTVAKGRLGRGGTATGPQQAMTRP